MKAFYKSPLTVFVVWHPSSQKGRLYGEAIFNLLCRDTESPLNRALGIPVFFRYQPEKSSKFPIEINTSESDRTAIVLLVDEEMYSDNTNWYTYVQTLLDQENGETVRLYPVALSKYAFSLDEKRLNKKQFVNLIKYQKEEGENIKLSFVDLKSRLLHDFARFFFKMSKVADSDFQLSPPPIKLFVSHAKVDGETLAKEFSDFVQSNTKMKTFFDVNDIADADDFETALKASLKDSAIVVFLSDKYSTREWCRIEVIVAKRNHSPLVVVNHVQKGEKRSFPYLGNVPTIRLADNNFGEIVDLALYQVLNNLYIEGKLKKEVILYGLEKKFHVIHLENTPELFNYVDIKKIQKNLSESDEILVIYPDPPLGTEELRLLNELDEKIEFISPSSFYQII